MPAISSSAPGKVILCGEHAVVYGQPAIALPVQDVSTRSVIIARPNLANGIVLIKDPAVGLKCMLNDMHPDSNLRKTTGLVLSALALDHIPACEIQIHSSIPVGGGLGSSASVTVSLARALSTFLGHPLSEETINDIAFEVEKTHHRTPSGIDNSVITYARPLLFQKGHPLRWLQFSHPMLFLIANSGLKGSTKKAVGLVREHWMSNTQEYETIFSRIGQITTTMLEVLQTGQLAQAGDLMSENHKLLTRMGVSLPVLDKLVDAALQAGAFGAKMTGGGLGGNVLALIPLNAYAQVNRALLNAGAAKVIPARFNIPEGEVI